MYLLLLQMVMIIYIYGLDTFRSRAQMKKMKEKFKEDRDPQGLNLVNLDCEKSQPSQVLEQILATPFLAEKRMVILENLLISKHKDLQEELLRRIEEKNLPEENIIIFWEGTDKFKTKLAKSFHERLLQEKYAQKFDELRGIQLGGWIGAEVDSRGGKMNREAVQYLVNHVGGDMWRLNSLIDQLLAYCLESDKNSYIKDPEMNPPQSSLKERKIDELSSGREVTVADVELFLDEKVDDNIFNLVDAIVAKQTKQVYKMIEEQYKQGKDANYVFAMVLRQFRILLEMRDVYEREDVMQSNVLAQKLKLHPFVVKKSLPLVKRYHMYELQSVYNELLNFDIDVKTGQGEPNLMLDLMVGRICVS